jgi:ABC-type multidrug transport system ATPase subunit
LKRIGCGVNDLECGSHFFDEPPLFDQEMINHLLDMMIELVESGMNMPVVTHEPGFATAVADRVIFMDGEAIIEEKPPEEFFKNPELDRRKVFLSQMFITDFRPVVSSNASTILWLGVHSRSSLSTGELSNRSDDTRVSSSNSVEAMAFLDFFDLDALNGLAGASCAMNRNNSVFSEKNHR